MEITIEKLSESLITGISFLQKDELNILIRTTTIEKLSEDLINSNVLLFSL